MLSYDHIQKTKEQKKAFAKKVAEYTKTIPEFDGLTKEDAIQVAVYAMTQDIGLAHDFLKVIGVDIDLYTYDFENQKSLNEIVVRKEITNAELMEHSLEWQKNMDNTLVAWGFDPSQDLTWTDNEIKGVRIYKQIKKVTDD